MHHNISSGWPLPSPKMGKMQSFQTDFIHFHLTSHRQTKPDFINPPLPHSHPLGLGASCAWKFDGWEGGVIITFSSKKNTLLENCSYCSVHVPENVIWLK